jgi:DNA modification methylase
MPTLDWIGKAAVVNHHRKVPYHLLRCDRELSAGDADAGNLLVQGDNLLALKALLPYYAGKVKCIFIDPPYNTGNEGWVYNDNVNSPEIRQWLRQTVGKEGEDLSRHDKWLCMIYPRLALLRDFLTEDGAIFISIDDTEVHNLRAVMDETFGPHNFLANFVWQSKDTPGNNSGGIAETHNHILAYRRSDKFQPNMLARNEKQVATYTNPDNDPRGPWLGAPLTRVEHRDRDYYALRNAAGRDVFPPSGSSWRRPPDAMKRLAEEGRVWWGKSGDSTFPMEKKFLSEAKEGVVNQTWWPYQFAGSTRQASAEMKAIFGGKKEFDTPKPVQLVRVIIAMATDTDSLILDSFAGSGTTGHAVLAQNKADGGNRQFILVEMDESICRDVTALRLRRVIEGYESRSDAIDGNREREREQTACLAWAAGFDSAS